MAVAEMLDLSRLPPPNLLLIDYERDLAERIAHLKAVFDAAGIPYDVEKLLTDPAGALQEADNYRETLVKVAFNEQFKQSLIAFAIGASLDWYAANFHFLPRMGGEGDDRFRRRIQYEGENKSGGRLSGYKADCMRASIDVADVGAWVDRSNEMQPTVRLALMTALDTGAAPLELVNLVQAYVDREDIKQATDICAVQSAEIVSVSIDVAILHRPGPDPVLLRQNAAASLAAMVAGRRQPHRDIPLSAIIAAATVGGVEKVVVVSPSADVTVGFGQLAHVTAVTVGSFYADG